MENNILKIEKGNKSFIEGSLKTSKFQKFNKIYDSSSNNTVVMLNIDRATVYEAKDFFEYMSKLIDTNASRIILDMESIYFIDSVFFGTLIKLLKRVTKMGGYIKLIVDYNSKPELLSISSFERIFEVYPNLFEAVQKTKAS
jgi:anti-anti-sigma factor